jgi:hypothetical protein
LKEIASTLINYAAEVALFVPSSARMVNIG